MNSLKVSNLREGKMATREKRTRPLLLSSLCCIYVHVSPVRTVSLDVEYFRNLWTHLGREFISS